MNIALILINVHYFDARLSKKINCYRQNAQNYIFEKKDGGHFVFVSHQNCVKFKSTHNIQAYL